MLVLLLLVLMLRLLVLLLVIAVPGGHGGRGRVAEDGVVLRQEAAVVVATAATGVAEVVPVPMVAVLVLLVLVAVINHPDALHVLAAAVVVPRRRSRQEPDLFHSSVNYHHRWRWRRRSVWLVFCNRMG